MSARPPGVSRAAWMVERGLAALATFAFRRAPLALAVTVAITAVFGYFAHNLGLNTDVSRLLPETFESVRDVKRLSEEFGGAGYVVVVAQGEERASLVRFAEDAAPKLGALESVSSVDYKRPVEFFEDRALYFMDTADLEQIRDRFERRRDWEVSKATGALLDEDTTPPPIEVKDLEDKYRNRLQPLGGKTQGDPKYYLSEDGKVLVLLVKPNRLASDFSFCKQVVSEVEGVLGELGTDYGPGFHVELSGRYKKRVDVQQVIGRDLQVASLVAFVLILAYVSFHFRRVSAVVLVFVPLISALVMTYGFAAMALGSLNILTSFIGAILLGLGVDNGLHLLNRYYEERGNGKPPVVAIQKAFGEAARASSAAMLTNVGAFLCLLIADFKAFREFGVLAASGMFFTLLAYVLIVPMLLGLGERLFASKPTDDAPPLRYSKPLVRWAPAVFYALSLFALFAVSRLPATQFNYDFAVVDEADLPSFHLNKTIRKVLGRSEATLVVFGDTEDEAEQAAAQIRARKEQRGSSSTVDRVTTLTDLVPKAQEEKAMVIGEIGELVGKLREEYLEGSANGRNQLADRDRLLRMSAQRPFNKYDLPIEVRRQFQKSGSEELANFVLISPSVSMSDGRETQRLAEEVRNIELPSGKTVRAAGEPLVLADILTSMQREMPIVFGLALAQQMLLLWLLMGSLERALLTIFPALVTVPLMAGLLPYFGLSFNYLNVILLPTLLGMGEDGGAHLVARVSAGDDLGEALGYTARGTLGAGITTAFGFGAMVVASHPGLRSFGYVAMIGLTLNLVVCLVFLPALIALLDLRRAWRKQKRGGLATTLATVGFAGATPRGGGTVGALVAIPLAWLLRTASVPVRVGVALAASAVAVVICNQYLVLRNAWVGAGAAGGAAGKVHDPQEVVIDELVGALLAMAMVVPNPWALALAFVLFRVFDIVKPWPVSLAEKRLEGGLGVIGDDVVAGAMAGAVVLVVQHFVPALT